MSKPKFVLGTAAAIVLATAALAGCSSDTSSQVGAAADSTGPATTASAAATMAASASSSSSASSAAASSSSAAASAAPGGTSAVSGTACTTSDLSLQVIQGAQDTSSATDDFYVQLTNASSHTCTLYGFPGVDLADSTGTSLGMKDNWTVSLAMTGGKTVQTLAPGTASAAYVTYAAKPGAKTTGYPHAAEVRVIPPGQTTALTAKIYNLYSGNIEIPVVTQTLNVGPMDVDGVPNR